MAKGKKFSFGFNFKKFRFGSRKSAFGLGFGEMSIMMKLALLAVIVIPVIAVAVMMGSKKPQAAPTPSYSADDSETPSYEPDEDEPDKKPEPASIGSKAVQSAKASIADNAGAAPKKPQGGNLAVVVWDTGYTTTKLPISSSTSWTSVPNTNGMKIVTLTKFQNGTFGCIARDKDAWFRIFTSPSITSPTWTMVSAPVNLIRVIELKDAKGDVIGYAGIQDNFYIWKTTSLTNPNWDVAKVGGQIKELYQLQDRTFAAIGINNALYLTNSLDSDGKWYVAPAGGWMTQLLQLRDGTFACLGSGSIIHTTTSLVSGKWSPPPVSGALTHILELEDKSIIGVGFNGGIWTIGSLLSGKWTNVSPVGPVGAWLLEY
jgi:hypothetical protein